VLHGVQLRQMRVRQYCKRVVPNRVFPCADLLENQSPAIVVCEFVDAPQDEIAHSWKVILRRTAVPGGVHLSRFRQDPQPVNVGPPQSEPGIEQNLLRIGRQRGECLVVLPVIPLQGAGRSG
jgi:hypothetical protein